MSAVNNSRNSSYFTPIKEYANNCTKKVLDLCAKLDGFRLAQLNKLSPATKKTFGVGFGILSGLCGVYIAYRLSNPAGAMCHTFNPFIGKRQVIYQSRKIEIEAECDGWRLLGATVKNWAINNGKFTGTLDGHGRPIAGELVKVEKGFTKKEAWDEGELFFRELYFPDGRIFRGGVDENGEFKNSVSLSPKPYTHIHLPSSWTDDTIPSSWTDDKMPIGPVILETFDQCGDTICYCDSDKTRPSAKTYKGTLDGKLQFSGWGNLYDWCTYKIVKEGCWKEGELVSSLTKTVQQEAQCP